MDADMFVTSVEGSIIHDFSNRSCNSPKKKGKAYQVHGNVKFFHLQSGKGMIVLMDHPSTFTVYEYVSIHVLSGSVSVLGYEISPQSTPLEVFSSEKTGLIEIKTETYERVWKKISNHEDLIQLFNNFTGKDSLSLAVLEHLGNSSVALVVKRIAFPPNLQFAEIYYPHPFEFNIYESKSTKKLYVDKSHLIPIQFDENIEQIVAKISTLIRSSKLCDYDAPRVIVCGNKNTGKSSLIRFLINRVLSTYIVAYYLDTDPGQTEFTPPGVVSLTEVTQPIIGPSFCHQRDPLLMIFTGSISPSFPDMYTKSVSKLMQHYYENYKTEPLFVNTMGWMEGFGLHCLENVLSIIKPTVVIEITSEDEISFFDYRNYVSEEGFFVQIPCRFEQKTPFIPPREMREIALLAYFGKCQSYLTGPLPIKYIQPYSVCWDKIPIYTFNKKIQPFRMVEAVSHSIVALCIVPKSLILKSDIPQFPLTLEDEPDNECIGFGFVRAVDETAHLLYIITPLKLKDMMRVNAIIKGNIMIPNSIILKQDDYTDLMPYTYKKEKISAKVEEQQDYCSVSVTPKANAISASVTPRVSADIYRKTIPKRYNRPRR